LQQTIVHEFFHLNYLYTEQQCREIDIKFENFYKKIRK
jgi:hypothetical protein